MSHLLSSGTVGVFILGILTGWLLEWIFVQLFVPSSQKKLEKALQVSRQDAANLQKKNNELQAALTAAQAAVRQAVAAPAPAPQPVLAIDVTPEDVTPESSKPLPTAASVALMKEAAVAAVEATADDMTRLTGIGPKLAEAMNAAGIKQYSQLAAMSLETLNERLAASGIRYSKAVAQTWAEQAKLAAAADWEGLKTYQTAMKNA